MQSDVLPRQWCSKCFHVLIGGCHSWCSVPQHPLSTRCFWECCRTITGIGFTPIPRWGYLVKIIQWWKLAIVHFPFPFLYICSVFTYRRIRSSHIASFLNPTSVLHCPYLVPEKKLGINTLRLIHFIQLSQLMTTIWTHSLSLVFSNCFLTSLSLFLKMIWYIALALLLY